MKLQPLSRFGGEVLRCTALAVCAAALAFPLQARGPNIAPAPAKAPASAPSVLVSADYITTYSTEDNLATVWDNLPLPLHDVAVYLVTYESATPLGSPIMATGAMYLPVGLDRIDQTVLWMHGLAEEPYYYTTVEDMGAAPVACFFAGQGSLVLMPDYINHGPEFFPPGSIPFSSCGFLVKSYYTPATEDLIKAGWEFLASESITTKGHLYITGNSEGAYAALGVAQSLEEAKGYNVKAVAPIDGLIPLLFSLRTMLQEDDLAIPGMDGSVLHVGEVAQLGSRLLAMADMYPGFAAGSVTESLVPDPAPRYWVNAHAIFNEPYATVMSLAHFGQTAPGYPSLAVLLFIYNGGNPYDPESTPEALWISKDALFNPGWRSAVLADIAPHIPPQVYPLPSVPLIPDPSVFTHPAAIAHYQEDVMHPEPRYRTLLLYHEGEDPVFKMSGAAAYAYWKAMQPDEYVEIISDLPGGHATKDGDTIEVINDFFFHHNRINRLVDAD